jgi:glycosyltransferase involved in cell wall biosynthesis
MIISVIITNYNYGNYLGRCIRSLIDQSLDKTQFEIIVVDDCSTDHSREVMQTFAGYIRPVFNERNLGIGASSNIGIKMALGRFVVRVDADDYVHRDFLLVSQLYLSMNYATCDAVAVDYLEVDDAENVLGRKNCLEDPVACGITFKMDVLAKLGLYRNTLRIDEEVDLRTRFAKEGYKIERIALPLYRYKKHPLSMTSNRT